MWKKFEQNFCVYTWHFMYAWLSFAEINIFSVVSKKDKKKSYANPYFATEFYFFA
jgi:hypothetical protein